MTAATEVVLSKRRGWQLALRAFAAGVGLLFGVATALGVVVALVVWPHLARFEPYVSRWLSELAGVAVVVEGLRGEWVEGLPALSVAEWRLSLPKGEVTYRGTLRLSWDGAWYLESTATGPGLAEGRLRLRTQGGMWSLTATVRDWTGTAAHALRDWLAVRLGYPMPAQWGAQVAKMALTAAGAGGAIDSLTLSFRDLSLPATETTPGVTRLSGAMEGRRAAGRFRLFAGQTELRWPAGWFSEAALPLTDFVWEGEWTYSPAEGYRLITAILSAATSKGRLAASGTLVPLERPEAQRIEWYAVATDVDLPMLIRYLPAQAVGEATAAWLRQAFRTGTVPVVTATIKGPVTAFPFRDGEGQFAVDIPVEQVPLRFDAAWPEIMVETGRVRFVNTALEVKVERARTRQMVLGPVTATIPDLTAEALVLAIEGRAAGKWRHLLDYATRSPLARRLPLAVLQKLDAQGEATLTLGLTVPLYDGAELGVAGQLVLSRWTVPAAVAGGLPLTEGELSLAFDANGITAASGQARWGGMPVSATRLGGTPPRMAVSAQFDGARLAALVGLSPSLVEGRFEARGEVVLADRTTQIAFRSQAQGLALRFPEPFAKSAAEAWLIEGMLTLSEQGWSIEGRIADRLRGLRTPNGAWAVAVGSAPLPPPAAGGSVAIEWPTLDLDRWQAAVPASSRKGAPPRVQFSANRLIWQKRPWHEVGLTLTPAGNGARLQLASREAAGSGTLRFEGGRLASAEVALARLWWPAAVEGGREGEPTEEETFLRPDAWPALRLAIDDLRWEEKALGRLTLTTQRAAAAWVVPTLQLAAPSGLTATATGRWEGGRGEAGESAWQVRFVSADWGRVLRQLAGIEGLQGAHGTIEAAVSWPGSPADFAWKSVRGTGSIAWKSGVFEHADPGVGRLLSVVSLPMLLRRLQFDFRDVAAKGLAFDRIEGSFALGGGYLTTSDFTIDAPVALAQIAGSVDLVRETQELEVRVVPRLGNTAATALAFTNPVAGVLAYLAQQVVGDPLGQILLQRYRVSGAWTTPEVRKEEVGGKP